MKTRAKVAAKSAGRTPQAAAPMARRKAPAAPAKVKLAPAKPPAVARPAAVAKSAPAARPTPAPHSMSGKPGLLASQKVAQVSPAVQGTMVLKKKKKKVLRPDAPPVRLPPPPVTSDSKMQKNRAGLSARELEHYRDLLLEKRRELLGDVTSMEREALRSGNTNLSTLPVHMADTGTDNYEQEFTLGLVEKDRRLLREINVALAKIQDGSYGLCEGTGKPIAKPRLEAQPWARYSIEHARALEKPMFRRAY